MHRVNGKRIMFRGDRKVIPSCVTSIMTVRKLIKKGCPVYLAYMRGKRKMFRGDRKVILIYEVLNLCEVTWKRSRELDRIHVVREFLNIFSKEPSRLPPMREVEISIETFLGIAPIA